MKNFKKTIISISTFALVMTATLLPDSSSISRINQTVPIYASAADVGVGFEYDICDGGVTITGYTGDAEALYIPSTLGGCPVRHIGEKAFLYKTSLKEVKIPEGVNSIGDSAFESCHNLNMISLPSSLEFIGDSAFSFTALADVVIPANVKKIGSRSFSPISSLKTVTIMGNTTVYDSAFEYSESIESIKFNYKYRDNFTTAFKNCVNLQYINNIPILNEEERCINTRYLDIIKNLENNTYVNKYIREYAPDKVGEEWQYDICNGEVTITKYGGEEEELHIPSTIAGFPVRHIGEWAFFSNTSLKSVKIPEGVESIGNSAFRSCINLNMISLPSSLEFIGDYAFAYTSLKDVVIPKYVTNIGHYSFCQRKSTIETVSIMGNTTVNDDTFGYSKSIKSIKFYYEYKSKFTTAFKKCENLHDINNIPILNEEEHCINTRYLDIIKNLENNTYVNKYVHDEAMRIVNEVTNSSMTDVQKAKALHDWIYNKVEYDYKNKDAAKNHIEGSVFLYNTTVCDGYAKGYNLLLECAGITSYFVCSDGCSDDDKETHSWNIVKLGDHYFHIDVCWDDTSKSNYWFMTSDDTVSNAGGAKAKWKAVGKDNYEVATPECKFSLGDIDKSDEINEDDFTYLKKYIENDPNYDLKDGDKVLADLDFNGVIDNNDVSLLRKLVDYFYIQRLLNSGM